MIHIECQASVSLINAKKKKKIKLWSAAAVISVLRLRGKTGIAFQLLFSQVNLLYRCLVFDALCAMPAVSLS